jgi:hypothetical protein
MREWVRPDEAVAVGTTTSALTVGPIFPTDTGDGTWVAIPPPGARDGSTAVYDPVRDRMVVFGGDDGTFIPVRTTWVFSFDGSGWDYLSPGDALPLGRTNHSAIYDPVRDRMVVFGGYIPCTYQQCGALNDVVALSLSGSPQWSGLNPEGSQPSARWGHTAIYDPVRDRMVVFGGVDDGLRNDVWILSLTGSPTWSLLDPMGTPPAGRWGHTAIYDPVGDRMVVFGGAGGDPSGHYENDVWELSFAGTPTWSELSPDGTPPLGRRDHSASYDQVRNRMVVYGGVGDDDAARNDAWALSLTEVPEWVELAATGVAPSRVDHAAIYDPLRDRVVVFAGWQGGGELTNTRINDTWSLSLAGGPAWIKLDAGGPGILADHSSIYDPVRDRMLVFGGRFGSNKNDVWALSLAGSPAWNLLSIGGPKPLPRSGHSAIYDPVRDRMVVFGGSNGGRLNDAWALTLAGNPAWSLLGNGATPREQHTAVYDPARDRMLVFGGTGFDPFNDVWALSFSGSQDWTLLVPDGTPPSPRRGHTAIIDPTRAQMVVFGGMTAGGLVNDTWVLSLKGTPTWNALDPSGFAPPAMEHHAAIHDPVRDRMVVHPIDLYRSYEARGLSLGDNPVWSAINPTGYLPENRRGHSAIYDPVRGRMVIFGGDRWQNDAWALTWGGVVDVPAGEVRTTSSITGVFPNPVRGPLVFEVRLAGSRQLEVLTVFNVQGQLVDRLDLRDLPAGVHRLHWVGKSRNGERVRPGVYFARLEAAPARPARRFVVLD